MEVAPQSDADLCCEMYQLCTARDLMEISNICTVNVQVKLSHGFLHTAYSRTCPLTCTLRVGIRHWQYCLPKDPCRLRMSAHSATGRACTCKFTRSDPFKGHLRQRPRSRVFLPVTAFWPFTQTSKALSPAATKEAKSKLTQLAGKKYGHDLSESQKRDVRLVLKELEDLKPRGARQHKLAGSSWTLLYTESTGSSGGKVGPLVGQVDQANKQLWWHRAIVRAQGRHTCSCM